MFSKEHKRKTTYQSLDIEEPESKKQKEAPSAILIEKSQENKIAALFKTADFFKEAERFKSCITICNDGYQMTKEDLITLGSQFGLFINLQDYDELIVLFIKQYHQYVERQKEYPILTVPEVYFGKEKLEVFLSNFKIKLTADEIFHFTKGIEITRNNKTLSHSFEEQGYEGWHARSVRRAFKSLFNFLASSDLDEAPIIQGMTNAKVKEDIHQLLNAFSKNFKKRDIANLPYFKEKLNFGEPLPFILSGSGHATGVMIYKDYMVYINTGDIGTCSQLNGSGIWFFKIAENKKEPLLEKILQYNASDINAIEVFVDSLTKDKWLYKQYFISLKGQEMGVCGWRAFKFLFSAALGLDFLPNIRNNKKSLPKRVIPFILDKMIGALFIGVGFFQTIPQDEHAVWYLKNVLKSEHLDFISSFDKANTLFEKYYSLYLGAELSDLLKTSNEEQIIEPPCDKKLLVKCYQNLQKREATSPIIKRLELDKKMAKLTQSTL